jgi:hypothetical protein
MTIMVMKIIIIIIIINFILFVKVDNRRQNYARALQETKYR